MLTNEQRYSLIKAALSNLFQLQQDFEKEAEAMLSGTPAHGKASYAALCAMEARFKAGDVEDRILKQMGIREDKF